MVPTVAKQVFVDLERERAGDRAGDRERGRVGVERVAFGIIATTTHVSSFLKLRSLRVASTLKLSLHIFVPRLVCPTTSLRLSLN